MASFFPVISSMAMFAHAVVDSVSPAQLREHFVPSLKLSPGPGALGVTMALERRTALEARTAVKTVDVNIFRRISAGI
jgi:hypothetical protein